MISVHFIQNIFNAGVTSSENKFIVLTCLMSQSFGTTEIGLKYSMLPGRIICVLKSNRQPLFFQLFV